MCRLKLDAVILLLHWGQTLLVSLVSFLCILTGAAGGAVVLVVVVVVVVSKILFFFFWNDSLPAVMSLDRGGILRGRRGGGWTANKKGACGNGRQRSRIFLLSACRQEAGGWWWVVGGAGGCPYRPADVRIVRRMAGTVRIVRPMSVSSGGCPYLPAAAPPIARLFVLVVLGCT